MPINKIVATKRGKAAIASAILAATLAGGGTYFSEPAKPAALILASDTLIKPWEGLTLKSHWDPFAKIWDICRGETRINGKPVQPGMSFTVEQCDAIFDKRLYEDYYLPLTKKIPGFTSMPIGVQASMISGAYNFGVAAMVNSTAAHLHEQGNYRAGCEAQTAFNKSNKVIVRGLVLRREMGDAQRAGEAEVCVSGL